MARQRAEDERLMLPARSATRGTRVYIKELAAYLHHRSGYLRKLARGWGILHSQGVRQLDPAEYVTEQGALRLIAHVRALQGGFYLQGKQFHEVAVKIAAAKRVRMAKKRALAKAEHEALNTRTQLALAIPRADTEDDNRGAGGIVIAETAVVSLSESMSRVVVMDDAGRGMLALLGGFG